MSKSHRINPLYAAILASLLVVGCSTGMRKSDTPNVARVKLTALQSDTQLSFRAPVALKEAERAVLASESKQSDKALTAHLLIVAERKVDTAADIAQARLLEDQRKTLSAERDAARLAARTREADMAKLDATAARGEADAARMDSAAMREQTSAAIDNAQNARFEAESARYEAEGARADLASAKSDTDQALSRVDNADINAMNALNEAQQSRNNALAAEQQADGARMDADAARRQAEAANQSMLSAQVSSMALQQEIDALNAKPTDRGLVVTLGDVLFTTGQAQLIGGVQNNLDKLASFLNSYPERTVSIEGHTDSVGSSDSNQDLSRRRADAVKSYLVTQGVSASRLSTKGQGEIAPVSSNDSATGRQQNRRVEVIISNPAIAAK